MLADMQAFLQKRQQEDEELREQIEDLITSINKLVIALVFLMSVMNSDIYPVCISIYIMLPYKV